MNHRETIALLNDYESGGLDAATRTAVEAHLAECEDCMELARVYRALAEAAASEPSGHPPAEDVVAYALNRETLEDAGRAAIEAHLAQCEQCAAEVRHVTTIEAAAATATGWEESVPGSRRAELGPAGWLAAAALLVTAILVYPAYLGLTGHSTAEDRPAQSAFDGPVDLFVLAPATRGDDARTQVAIRSGQGVVLLALELLVPRPVAQEETLRFELRPAGEQSIWSHESRADEVRSAIRTRGILTLAIPTTGLDAGRHELIVSRSDTPDAPLAVLPLDIAVTR